MQRKDGRRGHRVGACLVGFGPVVAVLGGCRRTGLAGVAAGWLRYQGRGEGAQGFRQGFGILIFRFECGLFQEFCLAGQGFLL